MAWEKFIEIHETKYFSNDISEMSVEQIKEICSFIEKENNLLWVRRYCIENAKYVVDHLLTYF